MRLSQAKRLAIEDLSNTIHVSAITIAELTIKASIGKLQLPFDPVALAKQSGFSLLGFDAESALLLKDLPFHHKDPFDRMLVSQSMTTNYPIMTEDPKFDRYPCKTL
jgi:PIN domain nuclease of toxin-antitoxin system